MKQFEATIRVNRNISSSWKVLGFEWPRDLPSPEPGQFFTFRPKALEPGDAGLLRRPLAFAGFASGEAYALYQIRGSGTKALAVSDEGSSLDIIGALGKTFPLPVRGERSYLLGGGIGVGPLLFLHSALAGRNSSQFSAPLLMLGFRSSSFVPDFTAAMKAEGGRLGEGRPGLLSLSRSLAEAIIATDDGTRGFAGTVMDVLRAEIASDRSGGPRHYYACGPEPMLSALDDFAAARGSPSHVSVEQWMACGVGACQGCVLPSTKGGYLRACADGPVFSGGDIAWER